MLCIISPYAAVYAHGAHRVGRHGARGKHLRHSCDLWAWWCCLRCYCWLGCQWRDGRRPLAPLQQRLLRRGKIRISCPEPADTWPHICIYTTSVWAAQAKPRSSQLATVWLLAVVSHSWCTSSQQGRLITIVTRRQKSSIHEIRISMYRDFFARGVGPPAYVHVESATNERARIETIWATMGSKEPCTKQRDRTGGRAFTFFPP